MPWVNSNEVDIVPTVYAGLFNDIVKKHSSILIVLCFFGIIFFCYGLPIMKSFSSLDFVEFLKNAAKRLSGYF